MQYNMQLIKGTIQYFLARLIKKIFFLLFSLFLIYIFRKKFTRLKKKHVPSLLQYQYYQRK